MLPSAVIGGESVKLVPRKQIEVVAETRNTGVKLMRIDSTMASCLPQPSRISANMVRQMCTLSATASTMMICGACTTGGVRPMPM